jgi:hypothetical protein
MSMAEIRHRARGLGKIPRVGARWDGGYPVLQRMVQRMVQHCEAPEHRPDARRLAEHQGHNRPYLLAGVELPIRSRCPLSARRRPELWPLAATHHGQCFSGTHASATNVSAEAE